MNGKKLNLGVLNFGVRAFSRVPLAMVGSKTGASSSGSMVSSILAKLKKEQPQLAESLVCWYSPNLQGMTNKQLYDAMLVGEYPILRDLSGNEHDMELHGFDGTSASGVDGDGNLIFDGVNDWGQSSDMQALTDYTLVCERTHGDYVQRNVFACKGGNGETTSAFATEKRISDNTFYARTFGNQTNVSDYYSADMFVQTKYTYNACNLVQGAYIDTISPLYFGKINNFSYSNITLKSAVLFDRTLTNSEIDWVKTNMLVSQEPKKYTINFYYYRDGEPILLTSKKINNGAEIGELPSMDVSTTDCTYEWYYDLTLSEDALVYDDDYVESDLNLYCSTMAIYQKMLDELDGVVLEDGTTAREHLVCMYSPRLQGLTKESVLADKKLADLSGNGYDMTLNGFTEDEQIVNADGALVFDGVDDWGMCNNLPSSVSNVSFMLKAEVDQTSNGKYCLAISNYGSGVTNIRIQGKNYLRFVNNTEIKQYYSGDYLYVDSTRYNDTAYSTTPIALQQYYLLGRLRSSLSGWGRVVFTTSLIFDSPLTTDEEIRVKQILKL